MGFSLSAAELHFVGKKPSALASFSAPSGLYHIGYREGNRARGILLQLIGLVFYLMAWAVGERPRTF